MDRLNQQLLNKVVLLPRPFGRTAVLFSLSHVKHELLSYSASKSVSSPNLSNTLDFFTSPPTIISRQCHLRIPSFIRLAFNKPNKRRSCSKRYSIPHSYFKLMRFLSKECRNPHFSKFITADMQSKSLPIYIPSSICALKVYTSITSVNHFNRNTLHRVCCPPVGYFYILPSFITYKKLLY
jgi:hypothetical protein